MRTKHEKFLLDMAPNVEKQSSKQGFIILVDKSDGMKPHAPRSESEIEEVA